MSEPSIYIITVFRKRWRWWPPGFRLEYRDRMACASSSREYAEQFAKDCLRTCEMQEAGTFVYQIKEPIYEEAELPLRADAGDSQDARD